MVGSVLAAAGRGGCVDRANVVAPAHRATAMSLNILVIHLLGDVPSPPLIGRLSDATSLAKAFLVLPVMMALAGAIWIYAAWCGQRSEHPAH